MSDDKANMKKQDIKAHKMRKKNPPLNTQQLFFIPYVPCESEFGVTYLVLVSCVMPKEPESKIYIQKKVNWWSQ